MNNVTKKFTLNENILKGKYFPIGSRDKLKATLANLTLLLGTLIMFIDVYGSIINGYFWMSMIEGSSAVIFFMTYIFFFHSVSLKNTIYIILAVLSFLFTVSLTLPGDNPQLALFWLATLPIYTFFFLGVKNGAKWSAVVFFFLLLTTLNSAYQWIIPLYDTEFLSQITVGYAAISYLLYVLEKERFGFEDKLVESIKEKEILYQELNHRVKNNLLMILSLVKLQIKRSTSEQTKNELLITQNRIDAIASLYESLHLDEQDHNITTYEYLSNIIQKIQPLSAKDIEIIFDIQYNVHQDQLLYIGLILNELATNAFKYAYKDINDGKLIVSVNKYEDIITMKIKDNGIGYDSTHIQSLGLTIVETLVKKQLYGMVDIISDNGVEIILSWKE